MPSEVFRQGRGADTGAARPVRADAPPLINPCPARLSTGASGEADDGRPGGVPRSRSGGTKARLCRSSHDIPGVLVLSASERELPGLCGVAPRRTGYDPAATRLVVP